MNIDIKGYVVCDSDIADIYSKEGLDTHHHLRGDFLVCITEGNRTTYISDFAGTQSYNIIPRNSTVVVQDNKIIYRKDNIRTTDLFYDPPQGVQRRTDYDELFYAIDDAIKVRLPKDDFSLALSSGHDSGAIAAGLLRLEKEPKVLYAYGKENRNILDARLFHFDDTKEFNEPLDVIKDLCDPEVNGSHYALAKNVQTKVLLSGLGSDELYTSGDFELLETFMNDAQEAYKSYDLDVRFPLLDSIVYRAYRSLDHRLIDAPNKKKPLEMYMRSIGFPVNYNGKSSFYLW